jgi:hypothetical protein
MENSVTQAAMLVRVARCGLSVDIGDMILTGIPPTCPAP